ncbi:four helix bundle protein [Flavobacterium sp.]|uniref:four helix bundle protein n=1 Tax=Flavobacterium sp. TaxID=239 RepID=UPI003528C268
MNEIKSYKDLLIWQKGISIVKIVYQIVKTFPQDEIYALSNQLKRASVSVPSNIAEGYGRNTDKSFGHFLDISRGSLFELETQLIIAKELGFITDYIIKTIQVILEILEEVEWVDLTVNQLIT